MDIWQGRMDYLHFSCGLSFLILALVSFYLWTSEKDQPGKIPWHWLGFFGLAHGIHEGLEVAALARSGDAPIVDVRLLLSALSYLSLLEFARRLTPRLKGGQAAVWLYGPLLALALSGLPHGSTATDASLRYFLALPGGLLASRAFFQESKKRRADGGSAFLSLSFGFLLYCFISGVIVPKSGFGPAGLINSESFQQFCGFPVQVARVFLGLALAVLICVYSLAATRLRRSAVFGLALVGMAVAAVISGWFFTEYLGRKAARVLEESARGHSGIVVRHIDDVLQLVDSAAAVAAKDPCVVNALMTQSGKDIDVANDRLDHEQQTLGLSVVYLMNAQGLTVAASNRNTPGSFVGKSYAFRPYFQEALAGKQGRYFALGVTSGERGYYGSAPVFDGKGAILGVLVAKKNVDSLEDDFSMHAETFLVSPEGVVFMSGRKNLLNRALWPIGGARRAELSASRQFGAVSFEPVLEREPAGASYTEYAGQGVFLLRQRIRAAGWSVVSIVETTPIILSRALGIVVTLVFGLVIMSAFGGLMYSENSLRASLALLDSRRRNEEVLNEQLLAQQFLSEVNRALQSREALPSVLRQNAEIVVHYLDAALARIWTLNPETDILELRASAGIYTRLDGDHARIPVGRYKIGLIAREARPVLTNAVVGDQMVHDQEWAVKEGMQAFAGYPLLVEGRVLGVLAMFARRPLKESTLEALGLAANSIAAHIDRDRVKEALQKAHDHLEETVRDRTRDLVREIEVRRSAEAALRKSERQLKEAQKIANVGSWEWDPRTGALDWSDETYQLFGVDKQTFTPTYKAFIGFVCPADREKVVKALRSAIKENIPYHVEAGIINPDGRTWTIEAFSSVIPDDSGTSVRLSGTIQDITERKKVEEERLGFERLIQSQKYESLGTLAGGIAHQFNNLMNVIQLNLEMALLDVQSGPAVRTRITNAIRAVDRTAVLTRQMLAYSGKGQFHVEPVNIGDFVKDHYQQLVAGVAKTIELDLHLAENVPPVNADALQLQQALVNLLINASEAIEEKNKSGAAAGDAGRIDLATGVMECDEAYLRYSRLEETARPGRYVYLEVADTGCGMTDETKRRLFDPFFSTKFTGRGLGLPAVLGIVRSHQGAIVIESRPGRGATVRLLFPVAVPA